MIPPQFEYFAPETLDEAISLLDDHGPEATVLAGGQSLIPLMKLQLALPAYVVDINRIAGLADITDDDCCLRIGSLTRESDLDRSEAVQTKYPILHDTTSVIADPLVRNMATVGWQSRPRRSGQRSSRYDAGAGSGSGRCRIRRRAGNPGV